MFLSRVFCLHLMDDVMLEFIQNTILNTSIIWIKNIKLDLMCGFIHGFVWYFELFTIARPSFTWIYAQIEHFSHAYHRVLFLACERKKTRWSECRPGVTSHFRFPVNAIPHWRKKTRWSECRPVLRSPKRAAANIRRLNNRKWRQSYCSVSERSRALALLNAALVWRLIFGVPHYGSYGSL